MRNLRLLDVYCACLLISAHMQVVPPPHSRASQLPGHRHLMCTSRSQHHHPEITTTTILCGGCSSSVATARTAAARAVCPAPTPGLAAGAAAPARCRHTAQQRAPSQVPAASAAARAFRLSRSAQLPRAASRQSAGARARQASRPMCMAVHVSCARPTRTSRLPTRASARHVPKAPTQVGRSQATMMSRRTVSAVSQDGCKLAGTCEAAAVCMHAEPSAAPQVAPPACCHLATAPAQPSWQRSWMPLKVCTSARPATLGASEERAGVVDQVAATKVAREEGASACTTARALRTLTPSHQGRSPTWRARRLCIARTTQLMCGQVSTCWAWFTTSSNASRVSALSLRPQPLQRLRLPCASMAARLMRFHSTHHTFVAGPLVKSVHGARVAAVGGLMMRLN